MQKNSISLNAVIISMRLIERMFAEIYISSFILILLDALLTGFLFFTLFYLVFIFFKIPSLYAVLLSLVFFAISFIKKLRRNKILEIEQKYPDLKERLRTSKDYQDAQNMVVMELHSEVMNAIHEVDVISFLDINKIFLKVGGITVIVFIMLFVSAYDFDFFDITQGVAQIASPIMSRFSAQIDKEDLIVGDDPDFSEEGRLAELGDEEINMTLDIFSTDIDTSHIDTGDENDFEGAFPPRTGATAQEQYSEQIADEYKETIRSYFEKINR